MSLSGDLGDVQVAEVMQFIHLGGRSGTLAIESPSGQAEIGFYRGQVVSARTAGAERLGELLLASGAIAAGVLDEALRRQAIERPRRPLGQLLVAMGALTVEALYRALADHVATAVQLVVTWDKGRFHFRADDLRMIDDLAVSPAELVAHVDLNTQMILLEALRLFDERSRRAAPQPLIARGSSPSVAVAPAAPASGSSRPRLQILSADRELAAHLQRALAGDCRAVGRVALRDAGAPPPGEPPPLLMIDLRTGAAAMDALGRIVAARPRAPVCAFVADAGASAAAFQAGARAVVVGDPAALVACVRNLARDHAASAHDDAVATGLRAGYGRLRRVLADLRSGLLSATMSLQLMSIISESVERAVFLLVRRDRLVALGAFGSGAHGRPLAQVTQGSCTERAGAGLLADALDGGQPRSASFDDANLPGALAELLGRPASGQAVAFPVMGRQRAVAVIYTDNGHHQRVIDEIDVLELATAQVGMAFENELLLRRRATGDA